MNRKSNLTVILLLAQAIQLLHAQSTPKKDTLNFIFEGKHMSGFLWDASAKPSSQLIFIVPGSGTTKFGKGNRYYDSLIYRFVNAGFSCYAYDKQGCGNSEGSFDENQKVENSALEVEAGIAELRKRKIAGSKSIGFWGLSRAGWVCPLVIASDPSTAFWISVSGTDDKETFPQVLYCWFTQEAGKSEEESRMLISEWIQGNKLGMTGTPEQYLEATKHLRADSFYVKKVGYKPIDPEVFRQNQKKHPHELSEFDPETGLYIYVHGFKEVFGKIHCPVLAIFGEKDCSVPWSRTRDYYEKYLGKSTNLTVKTFANCNHNLQKCETGLPTENLEQFKWMACEGYYETMDGWLKKKGFKK